MNFELLTDSNLVAALGRTLLHSIWQIAIVSLALFALLRLFRTYSPNIRYGIAVAALGLAVMLPIFTFVQILSGEQFPYFSRAEVGASRVGARNRTLENEAASISEIATARSEAQQANSSDLLASLLDRFDRNAQNIFPLAVATWLIGVVFFALRLGGGFVQLRRYRNESTAVADEKWNAAFERFCEIVKVGRHVAVRVSERVVSPIVIGVIKPVIIVPTAVFLQMSPRELELIIAHELIHIRRLDPIVNVIQCVCETVFFYHPGLFWISAQIRKEREFAADAAVTAIFEDSHTTYARALANLEELRLAADMDVPRFATAAIGGNLMQRIQKILQIKTEASGASSAWTAGLAILLTSAVLLTLFSFSSSGYVNAESRSGKKKLAIGFVSIPAFDRSDRAPSDSAETQRLLIHELKKNKVPAIGFLQGGMISDGEKLLPSRTKIARMWIDAGFEVGLGGFRHIWLYNTPVDEYIANIEKNEAVAKQLIGDMGMPPRYFSYPFLNTGKSSKDRAAVEAWLANRGYTSVKYTFDNSEWMYSYAYEMYRKAEDENAQQQIRDAYIAYMGRMFDHYEAYSQEMFGRDIPQTLVLTPSRLVVDTADAFFAMASKRGYSYVSIDDALSDVAYKSKDDFNGEAGISWFERWSMAKGSKLRAEPEVDQFVEAAWNARKASAKK